MDKIAHSFGDRFKESELKIFVEEINVIDEYLRRVNREKDYEYIYSKGDKKKVVLKFLEQSQQPYAGKKRS
uniref:Uncharacterized protein n=1 Tax=uncultured marine thaumarchaeote KM3_95_D02 TaxID=1456347 RepID=A0A075HWX7_9ARCH|nr:hypothetical protein [uncultured marine thaumarchaeote KM3_95_D02]